MAPLPILLAAAFLGTGNCSSKIFHGSFFLQWPSRLVSRLLIYCKAVKEGLQFANTLSEILCLQVRTFHYSGGTASKFHIFVHSKLAVFGYFKCIVSYCCSRENKLGDNTLE